MGFLGLNYEEKAADVWPHLSFKLILCPSRSESESLADCQIITFWGKHKATCT